LCQKFVKVFTSYLVSSLNGTVIERNTRSERVSPREGLMCRSIKTLRRPGEAPTDEEIRAASLQFVRKISGYRQPSRRNEAAFKAAVDEVALASRRLLDGLIVGP
jgi:hypothetical protein